MSRHISDQQVPLPLGHAVFHCRMRRGFLPARAMPHEISEITAGRGHGEQQTSR
jgi:hypothetical protein